MQSCPRCASLWSPSCDLAAGHVGGVAAAARAKSSRLGEGGGWLVAGLAAVVLLPLLSLPFPASQGHHLPSHPLFSHRVLPPAHPPLVAAAAKVAVPAAATVAAEPTTGMPVVEAPVAEAPVADAPVGESPPADAPKEEGEQGDERTAEPALEDAVTPDAAP